MKVLLTGSTGFLGRVLCKQLALHGNQVVAVSRRGHDSFCDSVSHIISAGCISSYDWTSHDFEGVDVVIHAAARAHILKDLSTDPLSEFRKVNVEATLNLARKAAESGVKRFVFISSIGVLGNTNVKPYTEKDMPKPHDFYSISKYEAETKLMRLSEQSQIEIVIIRPPLVYGPSAPGNFASLVKWVKKGVPLPLGAVHNKRSLVAIDNLVSFIELCVDTQLSPKAANQVFLISDGEDVSTSELLRKVANSQGVKSRLLPVPVSVMMFVAKILGKGAVADRLFGNLQVDSSKARDVLGWQPVVTMDEALDRMFSVEG